MMTNCFWVFLVCGLVMPTRLVSGVWSAGWSWKTPKSQPTHLSDDQLVDTVYARRGRSSMDHPTLTERLLAQGTYDVTERIESEDEIDPQENLLNEPQSYDSPSYSSSMFKTGVDLDSPLVLTYSHKINHG